MSVRAAVPPILFAILSLTACNRDGDYLDVAGGGFIFNYRIAEATYGIAVRPLRDIPAEAVMEATFEDPAGGEPIVVRRQGPFNPTRIAFATPPLEGVVKDHPYKVTLVLLDGGGETLQRIEKTYASELDQTALPQRPLAIGPGYQKNIDGSETAYPASVGGTAATEPR